MTEGKAQSSEAAAQPIVVRNQMPLWRKLLAWGAIAAVVLAFLVLFDDVLLPFVVGLAVAYFLDPVADWLEAHKAPRWLAATLALGLFAVLALIIMILAFPLIQSQVIAAGDALPKYTAKVQLLFADILSYAATTLEPEDIARMREAMGAQVGRAMTLAGTVMKRLFDGGMALVNVTTFVFVTPIVAFYLLRDWDRLIGWIDGLIPQ